ncbi:MAG: ImmA/IrrE family metallo-endopeptidase [Zhenhengia sp.]|uniref:ImmA/IrrE family metallo-endopeptidase n=1 Tax=Zhenhengia sp. TaxID=2944208 RepID=UPI00399535E9
MSYERLLDYAQKNGVDVTEKYFKSQVDGLCKGNKIGISKRLSTSIDKKCILAEELGHYFTTVGDITDQSKVENRKQERRARAWGYQKAVPLTLLLEAIDYPCTNRTELAEYLDVPEDYLMEALKYYQEKYGNYVKIKEYILLFEPLALIKTFE